METFFVLCEIFRGESIEGVGDDKAVFFMGLSGVLWVDGGLMAEGGAIGEVVKDEAFH